MKILLLLFVSCLFTQISLAQCQDEFCYENDSRTDSNIKMIGRIILQDNITAEIKVATGWVHTSGLIISAGHIFYNATPLQIEFEVPQSNDHGELQAPLIEHIYKISNVAKYSYPTGSDVEVGDDWSVIWVYPNSITQKFPGEVYGYLDMSETDELEQFDKLEVYGYGADYYPQGLGICGANSSNYTQQAETLSFQQEIIEDDSKTTYIFAVGFGIYGTSGAPVINPKTGNVIGIISSGYLCPKLNPYVFATTMKNVNFKEAFKTIVADNCIYVNKYSKKPKEDGTVLYPFLRAAQAIPFLENGKSNYIIFTGTGSNTVATYSENHEIHIKENAKPVSYTGDIKFTVKENSQEKLPFNQLPTFKNIPKNDNYQLAINNEQLSITNYPNPFNPETTIEYVLSQNGFVTIKIYNILGQEVEVLVNKYQFSGKHKITLNASSYPSGVYIYYIKCDNFTQSKKMVLMK